MRSPELTLSRRTFLRAMGGALTAALLVPPTPLRGQGRPEGADAVVEVLRLPEGEPRPSPRANATLVWDPVGERLLLFGGLGRQGYLGDVWALQLDGEGGARWNLLSAPEAGEPAPTPAPAPRRGHSALFDPEAGRMVIAFGQGGGFFHDVWAFDPEAGRWEPWSPMGAEGAPPPRYGSVLVYDERERRGVEFAGFTSAGRFDDAPAFELATRRWIGDRTAPESPRPQRRCLHTGVYDPVGHRLVIFGGQRAGALDDTWALDLETGVWRELVPDPDSAARPPARFFAVSAYDAEGARMLLTGGRGRAVYGDLWALDLRRGAGEGRAVAAWRPLRVEGEAEARERLVRHSAAGAFIPERRLWVLVGGRDRDGRLLDDVLVLALSSGRR